MSRIRRVVAEYGVPEIIDCGAEVMLGIRGSDRAQALFAVEAHRPDRLVGIIVWGRFCHEEILVLHLAVEHSQSRSSAVGGSSPTVVSFAQLVNAFLEIVGPIAGVERVRFAYWDKSIKLGPSLLRQG